MKKYIAEMLPTKKFITYEEAQFYTSCGREKFDKIFATNVTTSIIGNTKVYKVADLDKIIEQNILIAC